MPVEDVQELPLSVEKETGAALLVGAHTTRLASAAAATVPPPEFVENDPLPWNQLPPLLNVKPMFAAPLVLVEFWTRTMKAGFFSAKSMLVVVVNTGWVNISAGAFVRSVCTNPPSSPTALTSGGPVGGLIRSSAAISSRPAAATEMWNVVPRSQFVRSLVP